LSYVNEFGSNSYSMADAYNLWFDVYENQLYAFGRRLTVNAHSTKSPTSAPAEPTADMYFVPTIAGSFALIIIRISISCNPDSKKTA
jgi:hypothetical protein